MKNLLNFVTSMLLLTMLFTTGCKKESLTENHVQTTENVTKQEQSSGLQTRGVLTYNYYLDGKVISASSFNQATLDPSWHVVLEALSSTSIKVMIFTSSFNYIAYGNTKGWDVKKELEITDHLQQYAQTSDIENIFNSTGVIPQWYEDYVSSYINSKYPNTTRVGSGNLVTRALTTQVYADYEGAGRNSTIIRLISWLGIYNLNNQISSFLPTSLILGYDLVFDNAFYFKKMFTYRSSNNTPGSPVNFAAGMLRYNNKASSWMSLGY